VSLPQRASSSNASSPAGRRAAEAIAARDEMRAADPRGDDLLAEVEAWLAEHPP